MYIYPLCKAIGMRFRCKVLVFSNLFVFSLLLVVTTKVMAQPDISTQLQNQVVEKSTYDINVVDSVYGITMYEPLNYQIGGDSTRNCEGYACQSWVEDHYKSGQLLHKGYYIDGQLKIYKNYYPNGQLEREFKNIDNVKSKSRLFYSNGQLKTEIDYFDGRAKVWTDYYKNGNIEYEEEYHKSFDYYIKRNSYYKNGKSESEFELSNKKKLTFTKKDYYPSGQVKLVGFFIYDKDAFHLFKDNTWTYYNEDGSVVKTEKYKKGDLLNR